MAMARAANTSKERPVYIVDGARTPFIKARDAPGPFTPVDLAVEAGRPLLARQPFEGEFDEVILGCVNAHPDEVNPGRIAGLRLGLGTAVPGWTVQRNCGSGQQALDCAFRAIGEGRADLILAGGTEALSHAPLLFSTEAAGWFGGCTRRNRCQQRLAALARFRPGYLKPSLAILRGLTDPVVKLNMGQTAEVLAHRFGITRGEATPMRWKATSGWPRPMRKGGCPSSIR
jgi:acetyl-CoA C-acetyltransferase